MLTVITMLIFYMFLLYITVYRKVINNTMH
jgi:hypothetical protein